MAEPLNVWKFRRAGRRDARAIRRLIRRVGINPMGLDWRRFLIAVDDNDRLIGCGQVKPHADGSRELASIAVEKEWRGKGIARALIEMLIAGESSPLYLTCRASLELLYTRFGFQRLSPDMMPPTLKRIWILARVLRTLFPVMPELLVMGNQAAWKGNSAKGQPCSLEGQIQ